MYLGGDLQPAAENRHTSSTVLLQPEVQTTSLSPAPHVTATTSRVQKNRIIAAVPPCCYRPEQVIYVQLRGHAKGLRTASTSLQEHHNL